jgi:hypothetical protein
MSAPLAFIPVANLPLGQDGLLVVTAAHAQAESFHSGTSPGARLGQLVALLQLDAGRLI